MLAEVAADELDVGVVAAGDVVGVLLVVVEVGPMTAVLFVGPAEVDTVGLDDGVVEVGDVLEPADAGVDDGTGADERTLPLDFDGAEDCS